MNWFKKISTDAFKSLEDYRLEPLFHSNEFKGFHKYLVFDNKNIVWFFLESQDKFNELFFQFRRKHIFGSNVLELDENYGDIFLRINLDIPITTTISTCTNKSKLAESIRFLGTKKDYENRNLYVPHVILNEFFDVTINTNGTSGILKKYWHYPCIVSYAITPFNACFIMKSKQKYMAYFYSDFPEQTFLRIEIKKAFEFIKKLQDKRLTYKEIPMENQMDILATQI